MDDRRYHVELTATFIDQLNGIEVFLDEAGAGQAFDKLLGGLRSTVIPNLARFPLIGRSYLANPPQSAEALAQLASLGREAAQSLREYLHGNDLMLYAVNDPECRIDLLSIRHQRQLSFDFEGLWPPGN